MKLLLFGLVSSAVVALSFFGSSAVRASYGFVFESFFLVEFLLANGKGEFIVAVSANDRLVFHFDLLSYSCLRVYWSRKGSE